MLILGYILASLWVVPSQCALTFRPVGWLDRMVAYHRKLFLQDVDKMPPEPIRATLEKAPPGYVDPPTWDFDSVMRLIILVHESDQARPVRSAIRRAMRPTRRLYIGEGRNTFKLFPSLSKGVQDIYYEFSSEEIYADDPVREIGPITDESVIIVANPVESRLPSAHISVRLLKEIMEARAIAARKMPPTTTSTILWTKKSSTGDATKAGGDTTVSGDTTGSDNATADGGTTADGATAAGNTTASADEKKPDDAKGGETTTTATPTPAPE